MLDAKAFNKDSDGSPGAPRESEARGWEILCCRPQPFGGRCFVWSNLALSA